MKRPYSNEGIQDAYQMVKNIITQPLYLDGKKKMISLLEASKTFASQDPQSSDLKEILINFIRYPESTEMLLQELSLMLKELG